MTRNQIEMVKEAIFEYYEKLGRKPAWRRALHLANSEEEIVALLIQQYMELCRLDVPLQDILPREIFYKVDYPPVGLDVDVKMEGNCSVPFGKTLTVWGGAVVCNHGAHLVVLGGDCVLRNGATAEIHGGFVICENGSRAIMYGGDCIVKKGAQLTMHGGRCTAKANSIVRLIGGICHREMYSQVSFEGGIIQGCPLSLG